jgi:hypothetical protein
MNMFGDIYLNKFVTPMLVILDFTRVPVSVLRLHCMMVCPPRRGGRGDTCKAGARQALALFLAC